MIESFNGSLRDEYLNVYWFLTLNDARDKIERWQVDFNEFRPHSSLGKADGAKTRFVLIDAVGVEKSLKTESRQLEKKPGVALKDRLQGVAMDSHDDDTVLSLGNRLVRLAKHLDAKAQARIAQESQGIPIGKLGKRLISALNSDAIIETAPASAKA